MPPRRPVARTPAPCVPAPWRRWAAYGGMQASCGSQGMAWALPGQERAPGTRESTRENAQPWPPWLQWPPQAPAAGPGHAHLGPGSPQVNAFCAHQGPQAADPFTGRGGSSSVGPRSHPTQSLLSKFSPDFREYKRLGADLPPRGRVGPFEPRKTLSPPGRSQARDPPGRPGPRAWVPPPRARPTWPGTVAGPCSRPQVPGSSLALCLWRGGRRAGKWGPREKDRTSGWRGELPVPRTRPQGPCEAGLICPGWAPLPLGRLLVGLPALSLPGTASWPETGQSRL